MARPIQLGEGYRGASGRTGYLLRQLIHAFHTAQEQGLRAFGLNSPQFGALYVLDQEPGLSSADLARAMGVTPQAANLLVAGMEREGLVRRTPHPTHGRVLETYPTDDGLRRLREATPFVQELEARLVDGLGAPERDIVHHWLVDAARAVAVTARRPARPGARRLGAPRAAADR
jgi:DNA-binding MarR family transcriptional regulator